MLYGDSNECTGTMWPKELNLLTCLKQTLSDDWSYVGELGKLKLNPHQRKNSEKDVIALALRLFKENMDLTHYREH